MAVPCLIAWVAWWRQLLGAFQLRTPMCRRDSKDGSLIFVQLTTRSHSAPRIIWAHNQSSKNRFRKTLFHQWWCAAVSSSPSLRILWKVSWVTYKILLSISLSRNKEGNYLVCHWVMSPPRRRGMNLVIKTSNVAKEPTCGQRNRWLGNLFPEGHRFDDWMLKKRHRWSSGLSEMGQGELMGSIHCIRIPFILIAISQSHLSPLSKSYSANPLVDPKTHFGTGTIELFLSWFSWTPMLTNPCSMFSLFLCHDHILLPFHFAIMTILLTVSPTLVPLLTHSLFVIYF